MNTIDITPIVNAALALIGAGVSKDRRRCR